MRRHPTIGHEILKDSPSKYLRMGAQVALGHHERVDGTGYPYGLTKDQIPLPARIVAVADVFDALTTVRPYKGAGPATSLRPSDRKPAAISTAGLSTHSWASPRIFCGFNAS